VRICISVTNDVFTDQRLNRTAQSLIQAGNTVLAIGRIRCNGYTMPAFPYEVKRFRLLFNKGPLFYAEYNLRLFFFLLAVRADIFLSCDLDTLAANYLASHLRKKTLVYDSHEYFTEVPELIGRPIVKKIWEWIEKRTLPHIRYAYTVSNSIARTYHEKYGVNMEVIRNLPSGMKSGRHPKFIHKAGQESIILYQGSLNLGRGLELAIMAMKFTDNARLVIIGDGDIKNDLISLADNAGLSEIITFVGRIPRKDLFSYTLQADLGISLEADMGLNYRYALPNKLFDYIQAGVPVVVSDLPEMAAIVKQYDIGKTISTTDPSELASCFSGMLNNPNDRKRWKNNLVIAAEELCWEKEEAKLLQVFERAGKGKRDKG
jgi:glycosyltransferase involved in cell wall biosynthesis